jgi:hypothetical protein
MHRPLRVWINLEKLEANFSAAQGSPVSREEVRAILEREQDQPFGRWLLADYPGRFGPSAPVRNGGTIRYDPPCWGAHIEFSLVASNVQNVRFDETEVAGIG